MVLLLSPITPHLAEELWFLLKNDNFIANNVDFPKFNNKITIDSEIKIAVQVNGKLRLVLNLPKDSSKEQVEITALEDNNVKKILVIKQSKR